MMITCPKCKGSGWYEVLGTDRKLHKVDCDMCGGGGEVKAPDPK